MERTDGERPAGGYALVPEILAYYERGGEDARLRAGDGRLELWRTQDVLRRLLPPAPARILDVGGGSGVHAEWLAADGYPVDLVDPVPLHVAQAARIPGVTARPGDARALDAADACADVVLLLGPLYHLGARDDRMRALAEARRVVRPGGLVVAATISRYAGLHDALNHERWFDPRRAPDIEATTRTGRLSGGPDALFTTAYFHEPAEIVDELTAAGLTVTGQYGLEGVAWLMGGVAGWLDDAERREPVLRALRLVESAPSLLGASAHLLTAATRAPAGG